MASISTQPGGRRTIQFVGGDEKRRSLRLGKVSQRMAESVKTRVEQLNAAKITGHAPDEETSRWLASRDQTMLDKLAAVGLIAPCVPKPAATLTLAAFIDQYIATKPEMKPNTAKNYQATRRVLIAFFGEAKLLSEIKPGDCDEWLSHQVGLKYAAATIGRDVKRAKQYFRAAVRKGLIADNPFTDVKAPPQVNKSREYFITPEVTEKIIAACPDAEWRLIVALARYGGLRTPSETYALQWGHVDWEKSRIHVQSPKTAHHPGGESRWVPLFPELRPYLEAVFDAAPPKTKYVIDQHRKGTNLATQLGRIMEIAGVDSWPRLFQNLRASRETELTQNHPLHVVVGWIGNSAPIAARHYLQTTDADFDKAINGVSKAVQNPVQQTAVPGCTEPQTQNGPPTEGEPLLQLATSCDNCADVHIPPRGVEPRFSD